MDDRGPRPRRPPVAARSRRGVLPVGVPQPDAARRGRRRRPPRRQPRPRRARRRPRPAGRRVGALVRPARAGRAHRCRALRAAVTRAARGCRWRRSRWLRPRSASWSSTGCGPVAGARGWRGCAARSAATSATGCCAPRALPAIALASVLVVLGHAATFLIAARAAGATAPPSRMLPLALLAMLAMVLPSVAGWGPREGATAWVFGAAGLGAAQGVATAVVYGVMVLVASLPGALVLVSAWLRSTLAAAGRARGRTGAPMRDRPYTLLCCSVSIDGYIGSVGVAPAAVQRRRLRPGRRRPRLLRRDPGRRGDRAHRQPAAARALAGPPRRADGARARRRRR